MGARCDALPLAAGSQAAAPAAAAAGQPASHGAVRADHCRWGNICTVHALSLGWDGRRLQNVHACQQVFGQRSHRWARRPEREVAAHAGAIQPAVKHLRLTAVWLLCRSSVKRMCGSQCCGCHRPQMSPNPQPPLQSRPATACWCPWRWKPARHIRNGARTAARVSQYFGSLVVRVCTGFLWLWPGPTRSWREEEAPALFHSCCCL